MSDQTADDKLVDLACEKAKRFEMTEDGKLRNHGEQKRRPVKSKVCHGADFGRRESREDDYSDALEAFGSRPREPKAERPLDPSGVIGELGRADRLIGRGELDQAQEVLRVLGNKIATRGVSE